MNHLRFKKIYFPSCLKSICNKAFSRNQCFRFIEFPRKSELCSIRENAFEYCSIASIFIPTQVELIGQYCFYSCKKLNELIFSNESKIENIGKYSISYTNIKYISFPATITKFKSYSFNYTKLEIIEFLGWWYCNWNWRFWFELHKNYFFTKLSQSQKMILKSNQFSINIIFALSNFLLKLVSNHNDLTLYMQIFIY